MKLLVDAQLSARLARFLNDAGHDAVHTSALPDGNRSTDVRLAEVADDEGRVVVTKDRDTSGTGICCRGSGPLIERSETERRILAGLAGQ